MKRQIGVPGAVLLGLGSMLGTGVFTALALAAGVTGAAVIVAVPLAGLVALCNALSSAQLAAAHPVAGGTYEYGYRLLGPRAGFVAGFMFLAAKSASAATAALALSGYVLVAFGVSGRAAHTALALGLVVAFTAVVLLGVRRSNVLNAVLVTITLTALGVFVVTVGWSLAPSNFTPLFFADPDRYAGPLAEPRALLAATALVFVAYTGYGRIATLGEEVREPRRVIPIAIVVTLAVTVVTYFLVAFVAVGAAGVEAYARAAERDAAPLETIARNLNRPAVAIGVVIGAAAAMGGVLLNLLLGLSRVALAMARRGDAPRALAKLNRAATTPTAAVIAVAVITAALACIGSVKVTWSLSAFTVLIYYGITNAAALRLPAEQRRYPRIIAALGLFACIGLAVCVDLLSMSIGAGLIVVALIWHAIAARKRAAS